LKAVLNEAAHESLPLLVADPGVNPVVSEGEAGPYAAGLVTDAIAAYGEWSEAEAFLAGPPPMLAATGAALRLLGVAPERIHHDSPEG